MPRSHSPAGRPTIARRPLIRSLLLTVAMAIGMLASVPSVQAQQATTPDPVGGDNSALDLYKVKVTNNAKGVRVVVKMKPVDWSTSEPVGEFRIQLDTNHKSAGPEFAEEFGIPGDGGFRALKGSKKKRQSWETYPFPGKCGKTVRERWDLAGGKVTLVVKPKKGCLWHPRYVRVNVRSIQTGVIDDDGYTQFTVPRIDHLPYKKTFTSWVKYSKK